MIERLRLRNFRRYRDALLRFQPGVNFIEGLNNVGKTSLFYAIEYALFGRVENFKSIRSLVQPGKRSLGVELVLVGRKGERYLLQRAHIMPPRSRKTMEGYFTLKEVLPDGERYLLASDFGDTEDKLSLKLQEVTGLTRRLFSVALHMRQGDIAAILDGARQLDIVLGVTAASMAEDELRQMALELEKESAGLPVLQERLRAIGNELSTVAGELSSLAREQQSTADQLAALGDAADPRVELDQKLAPLQQALDDYEERHTQGELARQRLEYEKERLAEALRSGSLQDVEKELAKLESEAATRATTAKKIRRDLDAADASRRQLDQQRGDLAGRIERRRSLPTGAGAACEVCGAPIDSAHVEKELSQWTTELAQLDEKLEEFSQRQSKLQTSLDELNQAERKQLERTSRLKDQRKQLTELSSSLARRQKDHEAAEAEEKIAFSAIESEAKSLAAILDEATFEIRWEDDPADVIASIEETIEGLRHSLAERAGRQIAQRQALADLLARFEIQVELLKRRHTDLERDQAMVLAESNTQQTKAARAARFRRLSTGFKDLQAQIRSEAATKLATDTLSLHRQLSERDEFESLTIDPAHYAVQVVPRDVGEEVPAALYEGGGHRLLLGLSFRLAVARLVEHCPFLMLDEPTYGLDAAHREALLNRIANQDVSRQILLVTHQAMGDVPGHRIHVFRKDRETVVAETTVGALAELAGAITKEIDMGRDARIDHWTNQLNTFVDAGSFLTRSEVDARVEPGEDVEAVLDAKVQKSLLTLVKERLDAQPELNQRFKSTTDWKILNQLLTMARLKELMRVRIVKKGRSSGGAGYDVDELSKTFYGRQVLDGLGFSKRRRVLDRNEFEKVRVEFQKIKLTLPEAVEPTTTEKYFAQEVAP